LQISDTDGRCRTMVAAPTITTSSSNDIGTSSLLQHQTSSPHCFANLYFSKVLEISYLDDYLTSLLIGPSLSQIFHELLTAVHTIADVVSSTNDNNSNSTVFNRFRSILLSTVLPTFIYSASWQATFVQVLTLLANHGTSLAGHVLGLQVVAVEPNDNNNNNNELLSSSTSSQNQNYCFMYFYIRSYRNCIIFSSKDISRLVSYLIVTTITIVVTIVIIMRQRIQYHHHHPTRADTSCIFEQFNDDD
jgi:hypothetical protein